MLQTPEVLFQIGRTAVRKRITAQVDYHFRGGHSGPFSRVDIKIVNTCNLRCKMCGQWGEAGWHLDQEPAFLRDIVPLSVYKKLVDDISGLKPWVCIWGGEPLLYPGLVELIAYMKAKGLTILLNTNGVTLSKCAAELVDLGLDFLKVSIDGKREIHDDVRGLKGAFDKTVSGIQAVQRHKKSRNLVKPYVLVSATVNKQNAANLDDIFEVGEEVGADWVSASYAWYQTEESCRQHEAVMSEKLDTIPQSQRGWLWNYNEIDTEVLTETVRRIKNRPWPFSYVFMPELSYDEIPVYYRDHSKLFRAKKCLVPWSVVEILANGDVTTCGDYPDYIVGNIKESSILDLWNNERYKKFRTCLQNDGLLPVCTRCCGLLVDS
jgi:radical SAM protein with 4Fe4S-binding SPASM domain